MKPTTPSSERLKSLVRAAACCAVACLVQSTALAQAGHGAHVHGKVQANVAVQGNKLSVQFEFPLDSLLGFEHRPRTDAQRQAAQAALAQLKQPQDWLKPGAAARCTLSASEVSAPVLEPAKPGVKEDAHADLDASYEFTCAAPEQLAVLDILLNSRFKRIQRMEVQVAGAKTQSKQTLRGAATQVKLR